MQVPVQINNIPMLLYQLNSSIAIIPKRLFYNYRPRKSPLQFLNAIRENDAGEDGYLLHSLFE